MTPAEFRAVEKGYQLHLIDEQDQALMKSQIPQPVFDIDTQAVRPNELAGSLHENNQKMRDCIINDKKQKEFQSGSLSADYKKIMEQRAEKGG